MIDTGDHDLTPGTLIDLGHLSPRVSALDLQTLTTLCRRKTHQLWNSRPMCRNYRVHDKSWTISILRISLLLTVTS